MRGELFGGFFAGATGPREDIQGCGAPFRVGEFSGCLKTEDGGDRPLDVVECGAEECFFVQQVKLGENFEIAIGPDCAFSGETESGTADGQIIEIDAAVPDFAVDIKGVEIDEEVDAGDIFDDDVGKTGEEGKAEDVPIAEVYFVLSGSLRQFAGCEIMERPFGIEIEEDATFVSVVCLSEEIEEFRVADGASGQVEFQECLLFGVLSEREQEDGGTGGGSIEQIGIDGGGCEVITLELDGTA